MHLLKDKKNKIFIYLFVFLFLSTQNKINPNSNKNSLLKIKKIEVFGLSKQNNSKLSLDLKTLLYKNIFFVDKKSFQKILNENNLIENFYIRKTYPNLIEVKIKKADFLGITILNNNKFFIGSNGKLISLKDFPNYDKNLPHVFGKVDTNKFVELKNIIDKSNFNYKDISLFYYFQSNRWDVKMNDGVLIKLPQTGLIQALQIAYMIQSNEKLNDNKVIDLRISNHIITSNE